ncbi:hypothetical protein T484DRAFT_1816257, partial [Baffinella frigidus]
QTFIAVLVNRGRKPTTSTNIFSRETPDSNGIIRLDIDSAPPGKYYIMVHFAKAGYLGAVQQHRYTMLVEFAPGVSSWDVALLNLGQARPAAFGGADWLYFRVFVSAFSSVLSVKGWKPTLATYLGKAEGPSEDGAYSVAISHPVTGAFYYVGVFARMRSLETSDLLLLADTTDGIATRPPIKTLTSYFVSFDGLKAFSYRFYRIYLPPDSRDITILVTRLTGVTDIIVSNTEEFPTKSKLADAIEAGGGPGHGWWISESAVGGGEEIVVRNFDAGYRSPAWYYIAVFAPMGSSYFILPRLDQAVPTVRLGAVFKSTVAASAFSQVRFVPRTIAEAVHVIVQLRNPYTKGLRIYLKKNS